MSQGADPGYKDPLSQNVCSYVCRDGKFKVLNFLISLGVSPNEVDVYKQTPLFYAAREGRLDICKKLIEMNAHVNHIDMNDQTCLFYGAKNGHLDICKFLVESGAKYEHADTKKQTALYWAKKSKNQDLVHYLQSLKGGNKPHRESQVQREKSVTSETKSTTIVKKKGPKEKEHKNTYKLIFLLNGGGRHDVTQQTFKAFQEAHPDIAEYLLHPDKIPVNEGEKKRENWEKVAKRILLALWRAKGAFIFHTPVDPVKLSCFDYFQIIKNPMDFGTIKV